MPPYLKSLLLSLVLLLLIRPLHAQETCLLLPAPLPQRVEQARLIIEGKVINSQGFWDGHHQNIYTANQVQVFKIFKDDVNLPATETLEIITEGGSIGDDLQTFSNTLQLQPGQQGIFFLEVSRFPVSNQSKPTEQSYSVYSSSQGFIRYHLPVDEAHDPFQVYAGITSNLHATLIAFPAIRLKTVKPNLELEKAQPRKIGLFHPQARTQASPVITNFTPDSTTAGTGALLTITGSNFGNNRGQGLVEFKNANDGANSFVETLPADYISWMDNQIQVRVPSYSDGVAASGQIRVTNNDLVAVTSEKSLFVKYAVSSVLKDNVPYTPYHVNKDGSGGYTFQVNTSVNSVAAQAFARALQTWTCQTTMNWKLNTQPTSITVSAEDELNVVRFTASGNLPANILGRTTSRYKGCRVNNSYNYWVNEIDMEFNQNINWNYGEAIPGRLQYDFETVVLHELGHAHQLSHINFSRAVLHYTIGRGQVTRQLSSASDIDGGNFIISRSFRNNVCSPTRLEPLVTEACTLPAPLLSFTAASLPTGEALLTWEAAPTAELKNFILESSHNGINWHQVTQVEANPAALYQQTDPRPFRGYTYYRLRMVLTNQSFTYSPVRRIGTENNVLSGLSLYPNPIQNNELHLYYQAAANGNVLLYIYDTAGRLHGAVNRLVSQGNNPFYFDVAGLNKGLYFIQAINGSQTQVIKFIKL